jgi:acetyltransferase-like isoleucine patch superfamily enzyme
MSIKRIISRVAFHFLKYIIGLFAFVDHRLYMKLYIKLLKSYGLQMSGNPRFIAKSVKFDDFSSISIGDRIIVSMNVHFLTHDYSFTTALTAIGEKPKTDIGILKKITIGDNVFIGLNVILLPGCSIGNNVIIGAGSVIRGAIPSDSVVAGNPAIKISNIQDYAAKIKIAKNIEYRVDKK